VLCFKVSRSVIIVQREFLARFKKDKSCVVRRPPPPQHPSTKVRKNAARVEMAVLLFGHVAGE
jgi:hypothetical protein